MKKRRARLSMILAGTLMLGVTWSPGVLADEHIRGVIMEHRTDGTLTVQTDTAVIVVALGDTAKVVKTDGMRTTKVEAATLVSGLRIKADGDFQSPSRFVAQHISYSREDLKTAQEIAGGINTTDRRSLANQARLQDQAGQLQQHQRTLQQQGHDIAANGERIAANSRNIAGTAGAVEAANARITNLDDYNVLTTVTVYFANGKANIASKYKSQLLALASQAKSTDAYKVQVQGYASAVGPTALNQALSAERADAVVALLQQNGVPPPNIVVPAAMGISEQVAANTTRKGQAENRRTVVTLLQNKGVAEKK
jgi:OOP family OmpA-OmpF porin